MALRIVFLLILLVVLNLVCGNKLKNVESFSDHIQRVQNFACGIPQPRVIQLTELFKDKKYANEKMFPPVTVLHRCDSSSGCCLQSHFSCGPASSEFIDVVFHAIPVEHMIFKSGKTIVRVVQAVNHTSCACQSQDRPK